MKKYILALAAFFLGMGLAFGKPCSVDAKAFPPLAPFRLVSEFVKDPVLAEVVRQTMGVSESDRVSQSDVDAVRKIDVTAVPHTGVIENIEGIEYFRNLNYLNLSNQAITKIAPMNDSGSEHINTLILNGNKISDISALGGLNDPLIGADELYFQSLKNVNLANNSVSDLKPLSRLTQLQTANFDRNQVTSLVPLTNTDALKTLIVSNNQLNSLDGLTNKPNLEFLSFQDDASGVEVGNTVTSLEPLVQSTKLREIYAKNNRVSSLLPLQNMTFLQKAFFENNNLVSLDGLQNKVNLLELSFQNDDSMKGIAERNRVSSLMPIAESTNLKKIFARDNQIASLLPLKNLNALEEAYFEYNQLTSIDGMQGKGNLIKFSVMNNQVVELDPLVDATKLQNLFVRYNQIESISVLNNLPNLIQLDATHNHIADISAINFVHQDDPNPALALSYQDITLPAQSYTARLPLMIKNTIKGLPEEGILPPATFPGSSKITGVGADEMYQVDPMTALQSGSYDANTETVAFDLSTGAKKAFYTFNSTSKHDGNFSGIVTIPLTEEFSKTNLSWEDADKAITNKTLPPLDYNDRGVNTKFYWKDTDPNKTLAFKLTDKDGNEVAPLASVETGDGDKTGQYIAHDLQIPADKLTYGSQTFTVTVYDVTGGANHEVDHITLVVDVTGALRFVSAPAALDGGENKIISGTIQKRLEKATGDEPLVVTDSRQTKAPWALGLQIDQPFTAAGVVHNTQLPGVLNYLQNGVPTMVPDGNVMTQVYQQITPVNERNISGDWNATNGPAVIVPGTKVSAVKYSATLTWTLMDTPLN